MAEIATIARPYAEALFGVAEDTKQVAAWSDVLDELTLVSQSAEIQQLSRDPKVSATQLVDLIAAIVKDGVPQQVKAFLAELLEYRRLDALPEIASQFRALLNAKNAVSAVTIYSAFPLESSQVSELLPLLEKRFGARLEPKVVIDANLIGGVRAVVGDDMLDLSVRSRLDQMKAALTA